MCGRSVGRSVSDDAAHAIASDMIKKLCLTVGSVPVKSLFWRTSHPVKRVHIPICVGILPLNSLFVSVRPEIILDDRPVKTSTGRSPPILLLATFMVYLKFVQRPISCMCVRQGDDRTMMMMMITNEWANIKSVPSPYYRRHGARYVVVVHPKISRKQRELAEFLLHQSQSQSQSQRIIAASSGKLCLTEGRVEDSRLLSSTRFFVMRVNRPSCVGKAPARLFAARSNSFTAPEVHVLPSHSFGVHGSEPVIQNSLFVQLGPPVAT